MENCLAAAALNGVDRRSLQRSARLGQEVLERAKRRAVDWHSLEFPKGSVGAISQERPYGERWPAAGPERLLLGEREERRPTLSASFRTMAEFMDYTSSQCGVSWCKLKPCPDLPGDESQSRPLWILGRIWRLPFHPALSSWVNCNHLRI
ncbi:A-kinase interacting protein 1 [Phyllostomus discolor]|uniref:A-kinase interacting protein 1 n=1 Tax=Phyllostomus discolor TaxID=89673 RepID=A0A834A036_9CHIR|nr:A-kinase interacting protein 1 [Phyllostomus discolor]